MPRDDPAARAGAPARGQGRRRQGRGPRPSTARSSAPSAAASTGSRAARGPPRTAAASPGPSTRGSSASRASSGTISNIAGCPGPSASPLGRRERDGRRATARPQRPGQERGALRCSGLAYRTQIERVLGSGEHRYRVIDNWARRPRGWVFGKPESTDGLGCAGCRARNGRFGGCGSGWWRWQGATVAVRACGQEETAVGRRSQACWRQAVERSARPSGVRSGAGSPAAGRGRR